MEVESFYFEWFKDNPEVLEALRKVEKGELIPRECPCDFGKITLDFPPNPAIIPE